MRIRIRCGCGGFGLFSGCWPGSPGGESLSFASPNESNPTKGDPQSWPLCGALRCSKSAEFLETSRLCRRRTSKNLFPLPPALLSPARTGVGKIQIRTSSLSLRERTRARASPSPHPTLLPNPVLAGLEKAEGGGLKNLDVRRLRSRQVSRFSGSFSLFKEPRSGPDCGSPFLWLLSFGEAKESKLPPGNPRQTTLGENTPPKSAVATRGQ